MFQGNSNRFFSTFYYIICIPSWGYLIILWHVEHYIWKNYRYYWRFSNIVFLYRESIFFKIFFFPGKQLGLQWAHFVWSGVDLTWHWLLVFRHGSFFRFVPNPSVPSSSSMLFPRSLGVFLGSASWAGHWGIWLPDSWDDQSSISLLNLGPWIHATYKSTVTGGKQKKILLLCNWLLFLI